MSPMQRVAMGLLIVFGVAIFPADPHPSWAGYDLLADPVGWLLVVLGTRALASRHPRLEAAHWVAILAGVVSLPLWLPQLNHQVTGAGAWAVQVPQDLACILLCTGIARLAAEQHPPDAYAAGRFGLLTWGFVLVLVMPALVEGGGLTRLAPVADVVRIVVVLAVVYYTFRVHRRFWLGGPGPREITATRPGRTEPEQQ